MGKILDIDLPRPRTRKMLLEHPDYYELREELLAFWRSAIMADMMRGSHEALV